MGPLLRLIGKNLLARPLRYILTGLAITFGVAAVTAVFIFTDGLRTTFDELGGNIQAGFDIAVQNDSPFGDNSQLPPVPLTLLDELAAVDGVTAAQPRIIEFAIVPIDANGDELIANGPNIGLNWEVRTPNPRLFLKEGREPTGPNEFAIDVDGFDSGEFVVGDEYLMITPAGSEEMRLVGTFNFANEETNASVGAVIVAFEEEQALQSLNAGLGYDDIVLVLDEGVETPDVLPAIEPLLAAERSTLVAVDQQELIEDQQGDFGQILNIFRTVLLVFAAIILLVSAFLIFNVFTITLGQRIKELGLLRSIGAFGSQVTSMMLGEALILGVLATIIGIPAGWLMARLLRFGLSQLGFPGDSGLPIQSTTILYAVFVGVVVTMLAALFPSFRARQVTPIAALRDGAADNAESLLADSSPALRVLYWVAAAIATVLTFMSTGSWAGMLFLPVIAATLVYFGVRSLGERTDFVARIVLLVLGLVILTIVRFSDFGIGPTFGLLGAGALLTIVGASQVSGLFASPASRQIGRAIPLAPIVGIIGIAMAAAAVGGLIWCVILLIDGNIAGIFLPIGSAVLAVMAYGLIRTARGAFGLTGRLGRENAARNPSRTATTATALMIGLALVTGVTVIGESIKSSVSNALGSSITADYYVQGPQSGPQGLPFSAEVLDITQDLPETDLVVAYRFAFAGFLSVQGPDAAEIQANMPTLFTALGDNDDNPGLLDSFEDDLGITNLSVDDVLATDFATVLDHVDPEFIEFDPTADPSTSIWLEDSVASDRDLELGDTFVLVFLDGSLEEVTVSGIYDDGFIFGNRVIDESLWQKHLTTDTYTFLSATVNEGVDAETARAAIEGALAPGYPLLMVQDGAEIQADAEAQINQTLATVNILLLLSAVIAILGIAIALSLSVFERTREIGLLRAVGTTRQQTRWMVRWEGVIVAAFGGIVGVIVGVGLGVLATQKMPEFLVTTTAIPIPQLLLYIIVAAVTGLGAGAFPAWIAGKMNVLEAISNE